MGFSDGEILLDGPIEAYYAGQIVNGRLVFELQKEKKIRGIHLSVRGFCVVHWRTQHSGWVDDNTQRYTVVHDSDEEYVNLKVQLFESEKAECHFLQPGMYEYPFTFKLPASCPSSFEGPFGHIRYELNAVMDKPNELNSVMDKLHAKEVFRYLRVHAPLDLSLINCKDPAWFEFNQKYSSWCCTSGSSQTIVKIPTRGFRPGQVIPIQVDSRNPSSVEIQYISFRIIKKTTYRAVKQPDEKYENDTVVEVKKGPVPPHTIRFWTVEMTVPHLDVHNLQACSFIRIEYEFKVRVLPDNHEYEEDSCQIFLGTVPLGFENTGPNSQNLQSDYLTRNYPQIGAPHPRPLSVHQSHAAPNVPFPSNPYSNDSQFPRAIGFAMEGHGNSPSIPLLTQGTLPYPIEKPIEGRPFAGASAPNVTPDNEKEKTFQSHEMGNSPYNPEFMADKKGPTTSDNA